MKFLEENQNQNRNRILPETQAVPVVPDIP
jgi:hypothetical protein